jgi:hypothetical protein
MKLFLCSSILFFFSLGINAQVGVGTTNPATTLDVTAANPTGTNSSVDGILIPRVTRERAQSMTATPISTMIYVNEVTTGTPTGTTVNVTSVGFYFFNGTAWERIGGTGASNEWTTTGNTGIVDGTNFIGTALGTSVDVAFRRNNLAAGKISDKSTSFGLGALTSGAATTSAAFGNNALAVNTTGAANVAVGTSALAANITSANNTAVGFNSLIANTAAGNSAFGYRALGSNSAGTNNTAVGFDAGFALTGSNNIMIGAGTVAPGPSSNDQLNIGNTLFGSMAGALTTGVNTTRTIGINVLAPQAALDITSTSDGLLIPRVNLTFGANLPQPIIGPVDSEMIYVKNSVGVGVNAVTPGFYHWNTLTARWVRFNTGTIAATGWSTTGNAGLTAGTNFIGTTDLVDVSFKRNNTAAGFIGDNSTAFGLRASAANTGSNNTAVGVNALAGSGSMSNNVAIGYNALQSASGVSLKNTAVGAFAGTNITNGNFNVVIGADAQANASGTNEIIIGQGVVAGSYKIVIGGVAAAGNGYAHIVSGWTTSSDRRLKSDIKDSPLGLDFIKTIRPVSYFRKDDVNKETEYGFIAQELEVALNNAGSTNNGIVRLTPNGMLGVRHNDFISISIKAIQEQQEQIEDLKKVNAELIKTNAAILKRLDALESKK